ncbi:MAG: insulinase family protein [Akkermansia sp.]|nr:insulinase family protein [Akkermansia sp.]
MNRLITPIIALALTVPVMQAQTAAPAAPAAPEAAATPAAQPQELKALQQDPLALTGELANGLHYFVRPTKEPAGRACIRLYVKHGSLNEDPSTSGLSHFLEHMVFNGSKHFKRGELIPTMQKLGLGFGGDANAYTGLEQTVYMLDLPNLNDETVDFAFTILRDFGDGALLEDDAIDHERGIIVSELKARDSASYRASIQTIRALMEGTKIADYMPIGKEDVVRHASYETIRNLYRNAYLPRRMTVVVTGDMTAEQGKALVEKYFGDMRDVPNQPAADRGKLADLGPSQTIIPNPENAMTTVSVNVVKHYTEKHDTIEQRIKEFPGSVARAMLNQRLARMTRQPDCPFAGARVSYGSNFNVMEGFSVDLSAEPGKWQQAMQAVLDEVRRACRYGFSKSELEEVLTSHRTSLTQLANTWDTISAKDIASSIIDSLDEEDVFTDPAEDMRAFEASVKSLLADPDQCRRQLAKDFETDRAKLIMGGNVPEGMTAEQLRTAYDAALKTEVAKPAEQQEVAFAYDKVGEPGSIVLQNTIEDIGVTTITLSNGVKVNLKPIDFKKGSISVSAAVDGGSLRMPAPGLDTVAGAVMNMGGLEAHTRTDLDRLLSGHVAGVSFDSSRDRFTFAGGTTAADLELQCKLIVASILHPGYRPDGEVLLRRALPSQYKKFKTTPQGAFSMQSMRKLFGDDPRFVVPEQEQVEACTTEMVKQALTPYLQNGAMEVTIVGDFKVADVLPVLERTFGAMPQRAAEFKPLTDAERTVKFQPWGQREFLRYDTELDKTIVAQVRPAGNGRDLKHNRRLEVLSDITREKLFDGIRAELGETYSPSVNVATNRQFDNAAFIMASSAGVKGNREKVTAAMDMIFNRLGQGQITQEDVDRAVRPLVSSTEKAFRDPGFWGMVLAKLQSDPDSLVTIREVLPDIKAITLEEIQALSKEVFGNENVNYYFAVPKDFDKDTAAPAAAPVTPQAAAEDKAAAATTQPYHIVVSKETAGKEDWKAVVKALKNKHRGAIVHTVPDLKQETLKKALKGTDAYYVAYVMQPKEIDRAQVDILNRVARQIDDDPWGDCLWGMVTGRTAQDALRIAKAKKPLVIKRVLGTTNLDHSRFEHSYVITDWTGFPIHEQTGYTATKETKYDENTPEGKEIYKHGVQELFGNQLATQKPQMIVTSSHATEFNLEMPFGKGLIFPADGRFYMLPADRMRDFGRVLGSAMQGKTEALSKFAKENKFKSIEPDGVTRIWLPAGNCLFGNARGSDTSMAITALSAYTCNQVAGYTVPSWYGASGWGTNGTFTNTVEGISLAEAAVLNNQYILDKTMKLNPKLMEIEYNDESFNPNKLAMELIQRAKVPMSDLQNDEKAKDYLGLVHDRDVFAFYGDPAWRATLDESHTQSPFKVTWNGDKQFTITANRAHKGRCGVWFPNVNVGKGAKGCDAPEAVFTNDFILFDELELGKGESKTVNIK